MHRLARRSLALAGVSILLHGPLAAQTTVRVSTSSAGVQGNQQSHTPRVSGDGRYVAFQSWANNLVPGDTNSAQDVFLKDRATETLVRVSVSSTGAQANGFTYLGSMTPDGRYVTFFAHSVTTLVPGATNAQYYLRDLQAGTTEVVSLDDSGAFQVGGCGSCAAHSGISDDGRYVAFQSRATNLVPPGATGPLVFVRDRVAGTTEVISIDAGGVARNGTNPWISGDGRFVAFDSSDALLPGDTNGVIDVYVRDRQLGITRRVSVLSLGAQADEDCNAYGISAGGLRVMFRSDSDTLVPGATFWDHIFVHELSTSTTVLASVDSAGLPAMQSSHYPAMSADGRVVTFATWAVLTPDDQNNAPDVFARRLDLGTTELVSKTSGGGPANDGSHSSALDADGSLIAFNSNASNLVPGDSNGTTDVFVRGEPWPGTPTTYCTAKVNSKGCTPAIGGVGSATVGGNDDLFLTAVNILNNQNGIFFWGSAAAATPFGGGTLCVAPPVNREALLNSGGSPSGVDCTGTFTFHFSQALMASYGLGVGDGVFGQYWSRDVGFPPPGALSLTDGIQFVLTP